MAVITLGVKDLEESVRFYKDGLGFPKMKSPPDVHSLPSMAVGWVCMVAYYSYLKFRFI